MAEPLDQNPAGQAPATLVVPTATVGANQPEVAAEPTGAPVSLNLSSFING